MYRKVIQLYILFQILLPYWKILSIVPCVIQVLLICGCLVTKQSLSSLSPTLLRPPWIVASQPPLSIGFPRQEYWSGLPFPSPGNHPDPGIEPTSPVLAGAFFPTEPPGKPCLHMASVVTAHRLSCYTAYGIFQNQGFNGCPLHYKANS